MSRCVNCGQQPVQHKEGKCLIGAGSFATMDLPEGKTCNNCHFIPHCERMYGKTKADKTCDFFPIRFIERPL